MVMRCPKCGGTDVYFSCPGRNSWLLECLDDNCLHFEIVAPQDYLEIMFPDWFQEEE